MNAVIKAALRERPPKQCTNTPPASMPASMKIFALDRQLRILALSLSRRSTVRYVNNFGKVDGSRDAFRIYKTKRKHGDNGV